MSTQLALGCAAVSAATALGAALFELQQFSRRKSRWPWLSKAERRGRRKDYPTIGFWIGSNLILRMAAVSVLGGVLGGVGWIADVKAGIPLGLMGALSLSSLAGVKDTGSVAPPALQTQAPAPVGQEPDSAPAEVDTDAGAVAGGQ